MKKFCNVLLSIFFVCIALFGAFLFIVASFIEDAYLYIFNRKRYDDIYKNDFR